MTVNRPSSIRLISGGYIDLERPLPEEIHFSDIAGALSKLCRFGGQIRMFYSVAEHCSACAGLAEHHDLSVEVVRAVLMHDAEEAYLGDMVSPLKRLLMPYRDLATRMSRAIGERFGIEFHKHARDVKLMDFSMILAERNHLFEPDGVRWVGEGTESTVPVPPHLLPRHMAPGLAANWFTMHAKRIGIDVSL